MVRHHALAQLTLALFALVAVKMLLAGTGAL